MNKSVWNEEIDAPLIKLITKIFNEDNTIYNNANEQIVVPVEMRNKHEDLFNAKMPIITIANIYDIGQPSRNSDNEYILVDEDDKNLIYERGATAYSKTYQIDLWSQSLRQINSMSSILLGYLPRVFNLHVKDAQGEDLEIKVTKEFTSNTKPVTHYSDKSLRIFQFSQTFNIEAILDFGIQKEVPKILETQSKVEVR